jgi:hypothetical protein
MLYALIARQSFEKKIRFCFEKKIFHFTVEIFSKSSNGNADAEKISTLRTGPRCTYMMKDVEGYG